MSTTIKPKDYAAERGPLLQQMRKLHELANAENRELTSEEQATWDRLDADQDRLRVAMERESRLDSLGLEEEREERIEVSDRVEWERRRKGIEVEPTPEFATAFETWALRPQTGFVMTEERAKACKVHGVDPNSRELVIRMRNPGEPIYQPTPGLSGFARRRAIREWRSDLREWRRERRDHEIMRQLAEERALSVGSDTAGGHLLQEDIKAPLVEALLNFGGMRDVATIWTTDGAIKLSVPSYKDTGNSGVYAAEAATITEQDVEYGETVLEAWMINSKIVRVSWKLDTMSPIDMGAHLGRVLGTRIARGSNTGWTTGDDSSKPNGIVTAATDSLITTASNTAYTFEEMLQLKHSVDPEYSGAPGAAWMGNNTTLRIMKQIQDSQGRPLWLPSLAAGEPDLFDGAPFVMNQAMASGSAANALIFGDLSMYYIREVSTVTLRRLEELYAATGQVAFVAYGFNDGDLVDAGTNPVKYLTNAT